MPPTLEDRLRSARNADGGFGPVAGVPSEPDATALAAIALDDGDARAWLAANQRADGGFGPVVGAVVRDDTAVAAMALPDGDARERALDRIVATAGANGPGGEGDPLGWPWSDGTHGWVEPTAWAILALRAHRPDASDRLDDGLALLRDRESVGGGWNFGDRTMLGVDLHPYVQTTGIALFAVHGLDPGLMARGLDTLRRRWASEASGLLSLALAAAAFRRYGDPAATETARRLRGAEPVEPDTVALAWATIALGSGLHVLEVP
ncbi:MAG TPA: prenyltransferase/squalene oxidase repeat-containing protein [Actinomycetota bacterium]|nr:prenyltransferase/squalene oxidase repeat-containing protein [Actinomycetota bacterium]